jgi:cytochrome c oxidase assembly protein subunit 15
VSFPVSVRAWRWPTLTPEAYRRITGLSVVLLTLIVVTGGAVRLTGSGLGCVDWPTCTHNRVIAHLRFHEVMEFGNRVVTGLVSVVVIVAVLGSLVRVPRRRDLTWLSIGMVAGVLAQIVLGGILVLSHLWPPILIAHFVASQLLVWDVVVLHHRAGIPDDAGRPVRIVAAEVVTAGRALVAVAALAILTGTIVTGAGPHAGANGTQRVVRLPIHVADAARIHGTVDMAFLGLVLWLVWRLRRTGAPTSVVRSLETVLVVGVLQAAVGYTQYFTGVPELLVGLHILGATCLWISVLWFYLGLFAAPSRGRELAHGTGPSDNHARRDGAGRDVVAQR